MNIPSNAPKLMLPDGRPLAIATVSNVMQGKYDAIMSHEGDGNWFPVSGGGDQFAVSR